MDKKGVENVVADHLSRLVSETTSKGLPIGDTFLDEQLFALVHCPWYYKAHVSKTCKD